MTTRSIKNKKINDALFSKFKELEEKINSRSVVNFGKKTNSRSVINYNTNKTNSNYTSGSNSNSNTNNTGNSERDLQNHVKEIIKTNRDLKHINKLTNVYKLQETREFWNQYNKGVKLNVIERNIRSKSMKNTPRVNSKGIPLPNGNTNVWNTTNTKYKLKPIISADTAGSAKELADGKDKSIAAIASKLSANIYKLKILKKNIEDEKGNVTRFLIMGKSVEQPEFQKEKKFITTCIFRLKSEPAALYKSLGGFATNQVNMTKLESFSVKNTFAQTNFYLDFEGHLEEKSVQNALEELGFHTESLDILGVYEASNFRQN